MSTNQNLPDSAVRGSLPTGTSRTEAEQAYNALTTGWGLTETIIGENGRTGVPTSKIKEKSYQSWRAFEAGERETTFIGERYGDRHHFLRAINGALSDAEEMGAEAREAIQNTLERAFTHETTPGNVRALVDQGIVGSATPVEVDPRIVDVQRQNSVVTQVIDTVAQPGFTAQYNVINSRDDPVGFLSEGEAAGDLESQFSNQSFSLPSRTKDMAIQAGLVKVSDFSQRAEESLDYMDLSQTTIGQAMIAHILQKSKAIFYGDPSQNSGSRDINDDDAYEGLAKIASDAGNQTSKSGVSSGYLEDLMSELVDKVTSTGLNYANARFLVSPQFYHNALYEELTPTVRVDGYDADVEYGAQGLALANEQGTVPITPCPNIRNYSSPGAGPVSNSTLGDVFLIDESTVQFRQLAPASTVPLGRTGLADRVALFEYGTLIDKSQGNHIEHLQNYNGGAPF